jgi:hypothetical protein
MASQQFPPQKQDSQPGKEHVMDPRPEAIIKNYKAANKLQVPIKCSTVLKPPATSVCALPDAFN